jgi:hypothetical protein
LYNRSGTGNQLPQMRPLLVLMIKLILIFS